MVGNISIKNVRKEFVNQDPAKGNIVALDDLTLDVPSGAFISLIGPSGCGKSTLLRLIGGLDKPTGGTIELDGKPVTKPGSERGFAFQGSNLFPWLTVEKNIAFGLKAQHLAKKNKQDIEDYIKMTGLTGFEKSYPHQLSGGMQQRASLARSLVGHPTVLLLDEPLGALDAFTRMNLQDEILDIWSKNHMTMLMVTHDVDEAVYMSDRVVVLSPRPSKVVDNILIDLPRPRKRAQDTFQVYRSKILEILNLGGEIEPIEYQI